MCMDKVMVLVFLRMDQPTFLLAATAISVMANRAARADELLGELRLVCNLTRACPLSQGRQAGCNQGA